MYRSCVLFPVGVVTGMVVPNSLLQFGKMIECVQPGVNALKYNEYGCWCGFGGSGTPVDDLDRWLLFVLVVWKRKSSQVCFSPAAAVKFTTNVTKRAGRFLDVRPSATFHTSSFMSSPVQNNRWPAQVSRSNWVYLNSCGVQTRYHSPVEKYCSALSSKVWWLWRLKHNRWFVKDNNVTQNKASQKKSTFPKIHYFIKPGEISKPNKNFQYFTKHNNFSQMFQILNLTFEI